MADVKPDSLDPSQQRQKALSRWDNEGGAGPRGPQDGPISGAVQSDVPRPGFTDHPLTIRAATQMIDLVDRAGHFRAVKPS